LTTGPLYTDVQNLSKPDKCKTCFTVQYMYNDVNFEICKT